MEKINESKQITAAYDDALRYLDNEIIGGVKNAMGETKGKSADDLMYELIAFSFKSVRTTCGTATPRRAPAVSSAP